jgi:hypothetical protein
VAFDYQASSRDRLDLSGRAGLVATITADGGQWVRSFTLVPERSFSGSQVHLAGRLNLDYLHSLKDKLTLVTGVPIDSLALTLAPRISGQGQVAGEPLRADFAPTYAMRMDDNQLTIETVGPGGPLTTNGALRTEIQSGVKSEPNTLSLKLFTPTVKPARRLALLLLTVSACLLILIFLRLRLRPIQDEPGEIERKYGDLLVPVGRVRENWTDPVEVESIEALVHLAERYDRAILHVVDGGVVHHYLVEEEGSIYRYVAFEDVSVGSAAYEAAARAQVARTAPAQRGPDPNWPPEDR